MQLQEGHIKARYRGSVLHTEEGCVDGDGYAILDRFVVLSNFQKKLLESAGPPPDCRRMSLHWFVE